MYVVVCCEHLRDGIQEYGKIMPTLKESLAYIDHVRNEVFAGCNYSFALYELGKRIPLKEEKIVAVEEKKTERSKFSVKERP